MVVVVGIALLLCGGLAQRFPIAPAISLLGVGMLLGFIPALRELQLPPEVVLLVFLPALLYWESLTTSLREIRSNLRVVVLTSTVLVRTTTRRLLRISRNEVVRLSQYNNAGRNRSSTTSGGSWT